MRIFAQPAYYSRDFKTHSAPRSQQMLAWVYNGRVKIERITNRDDAIRDVITRDAISPIKLEVLKPLYLVICYFMVIGIPANPFNNYIIL